LHHVLPPTPNVRSTNAPNTAPRRPLDHNRTSTFSADYIIAPCALGWDSFPWQDQRDNVTYSVTEHIFEFSDTEQTTRMYEWLWGY
jgi:hypothetical protein